MEGGSIFRPPFQRSWDVKAIAIVLTILTFLVGLCAVPVNAAETPVYPIPAGFWGTVEINGSPAPVGAQVKAEGTGVEPSSTNPITITEEGLYGGYGQSETKLLVQGDILDGAELTFFVRESETAEEWYRAEPTWPWHSGVNTELNLTVEVPEVTTGDATDVSYTTATLNGNLTYMGNASSVDVSFEWGTTDEYGNETTPEEMNTTGAFSAALSGLSQNTTYHFRAKGAADAGTVYGEDNTFQTAYTSGGGGGGGGGDRTAPRITEVTIFNITETSADVSWKTQEKSNSQVEYWASPSERTPLDTEMVLSHLVSLEDLEPGTDYTLKVRSTDGSGNLGVSDEYTFSTLELSVADFSVSNLSISPDECQTGEEVTISVLLTNTGNKSGSYEVILKINDSVEETSVETVGAGNIKEITFTVSKDAAGSYSVDVNGLTGSFTVTGAATPTPSPTKPVTPPELFNWWWVVGIAAGVIVVVLILYFVLRRRAA